MNPVTSIAAKRWPLERILFLLAGSMTVLSACLAILISPWFLLIAALVGVNQWLYAAVRGRPACIVLGRACGLRPSPYCRPPQTTTER